MLAGCVASIPSRTKYLNRQARAHHYQVPLEEIWPYVLQLVREKGLQIEQETQEPLRLVTMWAPGEYFTKERYIARAVQLDRGTQIRFTYQRVSGTSTVELRRDLDLEWELVRLIDPSQAAEIESVAPGD